MKAKVNYPKSLPEITLKLRKGETVQTVITNSKDCANVFRQIWDVDSLPIYESMIVLFLNRANKTIGWYKVSQGGLTGTLCDPKLILSIGLKSLCQGIIICHNHPSGNTQPSKADISITNRIKKGCEYLEIALLDHIILTEEGYSSFADSGLIQ
jgi:DNA repair protein RadC